MSIHVTGIGWVTSKNRGRMRDLDKFQMTSDPLPEIPLKNLGPAARRMDLYSRLALTAIGYSLDDAGLIPRADNQEIGIIAATENACIATDYDYFSTVLETGGSGASPGLFAYTLPSSFLGEAAILHNLAGPTFIVNEGNLTGITPLTMCLETLLLGETDTMLCGIVNSPLPNSMPIGKKRLNGALFLVLQQLPNHSMPSYGQICFDKQNRVRFFDKSIGDLSQIVHLCS